MWTQTSTQLPPLGRQVLGRSWNVGKTMGVKEPKIEFWTLTGAGWFYSEDEGELGCMDCMRERVGPDEWQEIEQWNWREKSAAE